MLIRDSFPELNGCVSLLGVDVNPAVLRKARTGRYSEWSLRETPPQSRARWFRAIGRATILDDSLKRSVSFAEGNLATDDPALFAREPYDVVFCRNVLMYFTPEQCELAVARLSRAVAPGGYLFLGHAESLRSLPNDFDLCQSHETFYYRRKARCLSSFPKLDFPPMDRPDPRARSSVVREDGESVARPAATQRRPRPVDTVDLSGALALLGKEQYVEALNVVRELPADCELHPKAGLLEAALLVHSGRFDEGIAACLRLLSVDELNAGAYYLIALCREGAGDSEGAMHHHRVAAYIDPTFAMPRVHLGLISRRIGDLATARRELVRARLLLEEEDPARLTLFGGGFTRGALVALCEVESGGAS
jgi:chemotaxis protein methyltransferase CheR